jgi:dihydropteroate synthase
MSFKNTLLPKQTTLQSKGQILDVSKPVVMGILNATPDSFYNKGRDSNTDGLLKNAEKMLAEGAAILDIGGISTRPNAADVPVEEELARVIPLVEAIHKRYPNVWISIDTYNAKTAIEAVNSGAYIVNDVSSGRFDTTMMHTVASLGVPYIAMHMQGNPQTMQLDPRYADVVKEVRDHLRVTCERCEDAGIKDIIIDPGFGFGKTVEHNFALLNNLHTFSIIGRPILAGLSRKSMICKVLKVNPEHALNGTTALHMVALQQGVNILRVHDVKEAMEVIQLANMLMG